jgi:hypothetical protein
MKPFLEDKQLKRKTLLIAAWVLLFSGFALGQTALDSTTLNEAVDGTETRIDIVSSANAAVGEIAIVDNEAMRIIAVGTNRLTVTRGFAGTAADDHATGRLIYINPANRYIQGERHGTCTAASEYPAYTPLISLPSGTRYTCTNSKWAVVQTDEFVFGDSEARDQGLYWDGNAQDFYISLDDSADDLLIGVGTTVATTPAISIDENANVTISSGLRVPTETVAATETLTANECGKVVFLAHATEFVTTLPAPTAGCRFEFWVKLAPAAASYTVVTAASANILIGGINENEVDTTNDGPYDADGDTVTFVDGLAVVGDFVIMVSDGTSWYLYGQANADGGVTVTKAS